MNRTTLSRFAIMVLSAATLLGCKENASVDANAAPIAVAGPDQEVAYAGVPVTVTLDASGSSDRDGRVVGYVWRSDDPDRVRDPENTELSNVTLEMGRYGFTLWVQDDEGDFSDPDSVVIAVGVPLDGPVGGDDDDSGAPAFMPDEACLASSVRPDGPCKDCECTPSEMGGCAAEVANCLTNPDATYQMLCKALYDCGVANGCFGQACFTPCMAEITNAANGDIAGMCMPEMPELSACSGSSALTACRAANCMDVCM